MFLKVLIGGIRPVPSLVYTVPLSRRAPLLQPNQISPGATLEVDKCRLATLWDARLFIFSNAEQPESQTAMPARMSLEDGEMMIVYGCLVSPSKMSRSASAPDLPSEISKWHESRGERNISPRATLRKTTSTIGPPFIGFQILTPSSKPRSWAGL